MKSISRTTICAAIALVILSLEACKKENPITAAPTATTDSVTAMLTTGNWKVSSLTQSKEDNTSKVANYILQFAAGGKLSAVLNNNTTTGTWSYTPAVTYYGSSSKEALNINLGTSDPLRRLTGTWNIKSRTTTSLVMENPEILQDEHLTLQKQ